MSKGFAREAMRRWLGVDRRDRVAAPVPDHNSDDVMRRLHGLNRQVAELRGLLSQQADFTVEALRRAGWQTNEEAAQQEALHRALQIARHGGDVIAGPWTGEVGFELMYWIPFLNWLGEQGLDGRRLVIVSRGGAAHWYRHLTTRYVDILDLMTPDEFRESTAGPKKQYDARRDLDHELLNRAKERAGLSKAASLHPSAMFRLFAALWRKRSTLALVESFSSFRPLTLPPPDEADAVPADLPRQYMAAKFYFSKAFPDTTANRAFVNDLLRRVSAQAPVVLLSTSMRLDEHSDFQASGASGLFVLDSHRVPRSNLALQTRLIAGASGFIGTYGGFSYLAPYYGVRSVSFFSRRYGFEPHHLELADRVFDRMLPGGFVALHRQALDLVEPAVARWMTAPPSRAPVEDDSLELKDESVTT